MTPRLVLGIVLVLIGAALNVPIAIALGLIACGFEATHLLWSRQGIQAVGVRRRLGANRINWGETTSLTLEVWNRGTLPLSWVRTDDEISDHVVVPGRAPIPGEVRARILGSTWTLGPRQLVRRALQLGADRRGVYEIGPTTVTVGDLFALPAGAGEWPAIDRFLCWPRVIPAPALPRHERVGGQQRASQGLSEDPARFAGVRPYQPGDPVRRLHVRASARLGRPVVKRFEPSRDRDVLLVLDLVPSERLQPAWYRDDEDEALEALIVLAASMVRSLGGARVPFGLAAAGYTGRSRQVATLPVGSSPGQVERGLDLLARLELGPSAPFERLAAWVGRTVRDDTTVVVLSGRDPEPLLPSLRALHGRGLRVSLLLSGPTAAGGRARALAAGFTADVVDLDGPWRAASRVLIA